MKKITFLMSLLLITSFAFSQENCGDVIDLGTLTSPYDGDTTGAMNDFGQDCLTNAGAPDQIFSILVPAGQEITIGQTVNSYDSKFRVSYGETCPGDMLIACIDDPDESDVDWYNDTGSDQTVYWTQSAYTTGSGTFSLAWDIHDFELPTPPTTVATMSLTGCEASDSYTAAYDASTLDIVWVELDYDGGCYELTTDTEGTDFDTEIGIYDVYGALIGNDDDGGTGNLSSLTAESLPAGTYYIAAGRYNITFGPEFNVTTSNSTQTGTISINAFTPTANTVDFCNLQFPSTGEIETGEDFDVYAQVFEAGVTEPEGQGVGIEAWIGYSLTDATTTEDFESGWTWVEATYNTDNGNNDEYLAEIGSNRNEGTYYYVSRFSIGNGQYSYGGINPGDSDGNFWDGTNYVSGVLTVTDPSAPENDLCSGAIPVLIGAVGSCETFTYYNSFSTDSGSIGSCEGFDTTELDLWYTFTTNATPGILIEVPSGDATNIEVAVYDACDGNEVACVGGLSDGQNVISGLSPSTDYILQIWTESFSSGSYDICISDLPSCPDPVDLDAGDETTTTATLSWEEVGSATSWNIEYGAPGFALGSGIMTITGINNNPYILEGLTPDTDYEYYVQSDCGGEFSAWIGPETFLTQGLPPANDDCETAQTIIQETGIADAASATGTPGTIENATDSGLPAEACNGFTGNANDDVWSSFEALTETVNITYELTNFDGVAVLYSGTCGALTFIDCSDSGDIEEINATGLTVGETYYTRVFQYSATLTENDTYSLKIWSTETLGVQTFDNENAFSYFPNPVKHELTLKAQKTIENVSVYNMLGQEVLRTTPNSVESNMDMNSLSQGAYFVKVTIGGTTETIRVIKQ